jgi:NADH-quinone oxidoreductase subunit C
VISSAPAYAPNDGVIEAATAALGTSLTDAVDLVGEVTLTVARNELVRVMTTLRDELKYQQLMEIAGVDYPERELRFEVVYHLLSLTKNHRIRVKVLTDDTLAVPSVTGLWPVAGWLEREVFDLYGVLFSGNSDLRRILTDYGFRGHPLRKDFPLTGYVEVRYSEEAKRVVYEPVKLAQDFRTFDFLSPWEGAEYSLPGDEKAAMPEAKGAPTPLKADEIRKADAVVPTPPPGTPKTTDTPAQTGAGAKADASAVPRPSGQANPPEPANVPPPEAVKPPKPVKPKGKA